MVQLRKTVEVLHYDRLARESRRAQSEGTGSDGPIPPTWDTGKASDAFVRDRLRKLVPGKRVLDYGCGRGAHAMDIAAMGASEVVGIDLSAESLAIAEGLRQAHPTLAQRVSFRQMDAEALEFANESFDIVLDVGTFSSLAFEVALLEVVRVLRRGGCLLGVETLGHHPVANLVRRLHRWRGTRTAWATSHILRMRDLDHARRSFNAAEWRFFHLASFLALPLASYPGGPQLVRALDWVDRAGFALVPPIKRFAFKVAFVFTK